MIQPTSHITSVVKWSTEGTICTRICEPFYDLLQLFGSRYIFVKYCMLLINRVYSKMDYNYIQLYEYFIDCLVSIVFNKT